MQHPNTSDHARHDATLIAGHAAGDLTDTDRARADALLSDCGACGDLRRDLVAIAAATRSVPAPATIARDLRLTPEQADRLRRGSWLRTLLRPFGAAGTPIRPMATAFTSLGAVGLVVGITMSSGAGIAGAPTSLSGQERHNPLPMASAAAGAGAPSAAPMAPTVDAAAEDGYELQIVRHSDGTIYEVWVSNGSSYLATTPPPAVAQGMSSANPTGGDAAATEVALGGANDGGTPTRDTDDLTARLMSQPPNPLIAGSLALLGIGLLLFGLRLASTRVR